MKRYEKILVLRALEEAKNQLEAIHYDMTNHYFESVDIGVHINTNAYNTKSDNSPVHVDNDRFKSFVEREIEHIEEDIQTVISEL